MYKKAFSQSMMMCLTKLLNIASGLKLTIKGPINQEVLDLTDPELKNLKRLHIFGVKVQDPRVLDFQQQTNMDKKLMP